MNSAKRWRWRPWRSDGLIEAFTVRDAPGFTLALQWHPEWKVQDNELSMAMFQAFGAAARRYRAG